MARDPQQRTSGRPSSQRAASPAVAPVRSAPARSAPARTVPASAARAPGRDTDEFARLVQRNTVDVRQSGQAGRKKRNPVVGKIALGLAVVSAAVDASAFAVFMGGDTDFAFGICFVVVFLTLIAAVLGFVAAVGSFGRWYGAVGVVVAFFANPVILIVLLVIVAPELLTDMGGSASSGTTN
jgi:hypothetical protein